MLNQNDIIAEAIKYTREQLEDVKTEERAKLEYGLETLRAKQGENGEMYKFMQSLLVNLSDEDAIMILESKELNGNTDN